MWCPYRRPTQVGEEKILRRLRELWPRNSANFHRNFGRRWAAFGEGTCSRSLTRSQRNGGSARLPKTQHPANSQEEVYGLAPAPCRRGKGDRHGGYTPPALSRSPTDR